MRYQFLLFDADNTLFNFHAGEKNAFTAALSDFSIENKDGFYPFYSEINNSLWKRYETGEIEKKDIFARRFAIFAEATGITVDPLLLNESYKAHLGKEAILMPKAEETLNALKTAGYRLFLITNGDAAVQTSRLTKSGLRRYFEAVFISESIGHAKPSPLFFEAVANAIEGFTKEKALVIGDSESSDILGANRFGIDACHVAAKSPPLSDQVYAKYQIQTLSELKTILLST